MKCYIVMVRVDDSVPSAVTAEDVARHVQTARGVVQAEAKEVKPSTGVDWSKYTGWGEYTGE